MNIIVSIACVERYICDIVLVRGAQESSSDEKRERRNEMRRLFVSDLKITN